MPTAPEARDVSSRPPSLARSFMRWLRLDGYDLLNEITVEQRRHRVAIRFKRLHDLRGILGDNAISVTAINRGRRWANVYVEHAEPVRSARGWHSRDDPTQLFDTREDLWSELLFSPFRKWVVGPLAEMNCIEFIAHGDEKVARLHPDKEVPYRISWERQRYWRKRAWLATVLPADDLVAYDDEHEREIDDLWADFREPVDYEELNRISTAALGPEGIEYLSGLSDADFKPFNLAEISMDRRLDEDRAPTE